MPLKSRKTSPTSAVQSLPSILSWVRERLRFLKWLDPFTYVDMWVLPRINPKNVDWINWVTYLVFAFVFAFLLYTLLGALLGTRFPLVIVVSGSMEPVYYRGDIIVLQGLSPETLRAPALELPRDSLANVPFSELAISYCSSRSSSILQPCSEFKEKLMTGQLNVSEFAVRSLVFLDNNTEIPIATQGDVVVYFSSIQGRPIIHRVVAKLQAQDGWYVLTKGDSINNPLVDQESSITYGPTEVSELQGKTLFRIPLAGYVKLLLVDDVQVLLFGCRNPEGCPLP